MQKKKQAEHTHTHTDGRTMLYSDASVAGILPSIFDEEEDAANVHV